MEPLKLAQAVGAPAVLSLVILALGHRAWRRDDADGAARGRDAINAATIAGALLLGFALQGLWQGVWAGNAARRMPLVAVAVLAAELAARFWPRAALAARAAAVAFILAALALPYLHFKPWPERFGLWMPGLGLALLAWWFTLDRLSTRERGVRFPILLWVTGSAASVLLLLGGQSEVLALVAASVAAGLGGVVVLTAWRPRVSARGAAATAAALLGSLLLIGNLGNSLPAWMAASVVALPFTVMVTRVPRVARLRPWKATLVCLIGALAIISPALIVAYRAYTAVNWY